VKSGKIVLFGQAYRFSLLGDAGVQGLEPGVVFRQFQEFIQFERPGRSLRGAGGGTGVWGGWLRRGVQFGLGRFPALQPLELAVKIVAQFHLGLEHIGLQNPGR
jgi:hypothetical protein